MSYRKNFSDSVKVRAGNINDVYLNASTIDDIEVLRYAYCRFVSINKSWIKAYHETLMRKKYRPDPQSLDTYEQHCQECAGRALGASRKIHFRLTELNA